jgi:hypothetical protein
MRAAHRQKTGNSRHTRVWPVDGEKFNVLNGASGIAGCYARAAVTNAGDFRAAPSTRTSADGGGRWREPGLAEGNAFGFAAKRGEYDDDDRDHAATAASASA